MPLAKDLMGSGYSFGQATGADGQVASAISAAGTTQATATAITASVNLVSTVASLAGVQLYNGSIGDTQIVFNDQGVNTLVVYPPTSAKINGLSTNAGVQVAPNTFIEFFKVTSTRWIADLSA